ncbi:MAG: hypothetical protein ABSB79_05700 [Syntrophales bacterium]|jgi:hypothetical protein
MEGVDSIPASLDETIFEIAVILARGYLRYRKGRSLGKDEPEEADFPHKIEES